MTKRTLTVELKLQDNDRFEVCVLDNESGMSRTFDQNTFNIDVAIGVEIMSWLDMMEVDDNE